MTVARVSIVLCLSCALALPAYADETTVGITLNGTTGAHIEPDRTEVLPFLPLPMLEIEHVHDNLRLRLEGVPAIGPVSLTQGETIFGSANQDPRVSYFDGELSYGLGQRIAFGVGETVINQRTVYPPSPLVQASRVVGLRLVGNAVLYAAGRQRIEADVAVNPALQGLQTSALTQPAPGFPPQSMAPLAEHGSLVDSSLRFSVDGRNFILAYGVRYLNYTAAYRSGGLADRNHLFMPFAGLDWRLHSQHAVDPPQAKNSFSASTLPTAPAHETSFSVTTLATNGSRTSTGGYSADLLNFGLEPEFSLAHAFERYELDVDTIVPNEGPDPFGAQQQEWSYVDVAAMVRSHDLRYAVGLGEVFTDLQPSQPGPFETYVARSQAVQFVGRATLWRNLRGRVDVAISAQPYVHDTERIVSTVIPPLFPDVLLIDHGARVDASIGRFSTVGRYRFNYGLRYINQTTNDGPFELQVGTRPGALLARSTSLMPFVGLTIPISEAARR
jgi:hypothetical protein